MRYYITTKDNKLTGKFKYTLKRKSAIEITEEEYNKIPDDTLHECNEYSYKWENGKAALRTDRTYLDKIEEFNNLEIEKQSAREQDKRIQAKLREIALRELGEKCL